jgi:hypothetical protein
MRQAWITNKTRSVGLVSGLLLHRTGKGRDRMALGIPGGKVSTQLPGPWESSGHEGL